MQLRAAVTKAAAAWVDPKPAAYKARDAPSDWELAEVEGQDWRLVARVGDRIEVLSGSGWNRQGPLAGGARVGQTAILVGVENGRDDDDGGGGGDDDDEDEDGMHRSWAARLPNMV